MEYGKKNTRNVARCLECGDAIAYGRSDKKFCSEDCKNRHHNHQSRSSRNIRRRVTAMLEKNYEVLDELVRSGIESVRLSDVLLMGFNPLYVTSYRKLRNHQEYLCFDIRYIMTPSRLCSISKIQNLSLNLQAGPEGEDREKHCKL